MEEIKLTELERELIIKRREAEQRRQEIDSLFSFYDTPEDEGCSFANGEWNVQRSKEFYNKFLDTLIEALNKYETWIKEGTGYSDGFTRENILGGSLVGRFLSDGNSPLYKWWALQAQICPKCYIEWGQMYYKLRCNHTYKEK